MNGNKKKLIEVALPLPEINDASSYDKMPGIGPHPKGIHHWWARLPLPTARAILFASVVDDPSAHPEKFPTEEAQNSERERLFDIIRRMMQKKLHEHPEVYEEARQEMLKHCGGKLPPVLDPFSGGGSIPLEANRMGFEAHAADLNPVAVLLNKCNLEIIPRWKDCPPVNPEMRDDPLRKQEWKGARGLAEDVRYYGRKIREKAIEKIGHLYPKVMLPKEYGGKEANVIAWLWARTVASPNPAAQGAHVPLLRSFWLSAKNGKKIYAYPIIDKTTNTFKFEIRSTTPPEGFDPSKGTVKKTGARCILTDTPISLDYIREEGKQNRISKRLIAIVAEINHGRVFLSPDPNHESIADLSTPDYYPETDLPQKALGFRVQLYGFDKHYKLFTNRQLASIITFSDLIKSEKENIIADAFDSGLNVKEATDYANNIILFFALVLNRCASFNNSLCRWNGSQTVFLFTRATISMIWDFSEANIMGEKAVCWSTAVNICAEAMEAIATNKIAKSTAEQVDAAATGKLRDGLLISTDPPYYDNIGYAALSDFFYIWLRKTVGELFPILFSTVLVPKMQELTASPERFENDKEKAKEHFESGFRNAFTSLLKRANPKYPLTIYYAFKQADEESVLNDSEEQIEDTNTIDLTTGWETLLEALLGSGYEITATWPIRASFEWRMRAHSSNALASYIVLACRPRSSDASQCSRREFLNELKRDLPSALKHLQQGNIAPVDLAQASIGPGMAIFSRYAKIIESSGNAMTVRTALSLINQTLDEVLAEQEGEFDADTRWALAWFEQHGMEEGQFGVAETLSKAKNTAINGLVQAGMISSHGGKVKLLGRSELSADWDPATESRLTIWDTTQHLIRALDNKGEQGAADLLRKIGSAGEIARDLAYRLFKICEKKGWTQEALLYNGLVIAWPEISKLASAAVPKKESEQISLL